MPLAHILAFVAGILAVHSLRELPPAPWLLLLALPILLPWRWRLPFALFALGLLLTCWRAQGLLDQRWPPERQDQQAWVQGRVASLPESNTHPSLKGEAQETVWRFLFEPEADGVPQRIRVAWYGGPQKLSGADCWRLKLRLKSPHGSLNPGGSDYEGWLFRQGIGATATVVEGQPCADASGYQVLRWRQDIVDHLRGWLPQHPGLGLVAAMIVGDTSMLRDADWDDFRQTGTTHLIAISGFNVAIVAGAAFFVLRWLWALWPALCLRLPAQKAGMLGAALLALLYALLAGFEPPVVRAVAMLWLLLAAAFLHRLTQPARVLGLAAFLLLLADPFAAMAPGFWLSFGAVAAIFYFSSHRLGAAHPVRTALLLQLMLSIVLVPLTLYFFNGFSWISAVVNLLAVPVFAVLTPLLLIAVLLAWLLPWPGIELLQASADLMAWLREGLGWLAAHAPQLWVAGAPPIAALLLALVGGLLLFAPAGLPLRRLAVLCFLPLLLPPDTAPQQGFELTVLDVGQGLATVIRTREHTLVMDAGPAQDEGFDSGASIVAPYLLSRGLRHVDTLLISHADTDHSGGVEALKRLLDVREQRGALSSQPCRDGQQWDWDGVHFQILHPDSAVWSDNNGGCVLKVSIGAQAVLLPADIEQAAEDRLLREHAADLHAQLLVAPHHGSRTSSLQDFIAAVHPRTVIFSAGWKHRFGHPHPDVVARYASAGAGMYDTGWAGALGVIVTQDGISPVQGWRRMHSRFWNAKPDDMPPVNQAPP